MLSNISIADLAQLVVFLISLTAFAITQREKIKALSQTVESLKAELSMHSNNEKLHLSERLYQELMRRFDRIETKLDSR